MGILIKVTYSMLKVHSSSLAVVEVSERNGQYSLYCTVYHVKEEKEGQGNI